MSAPYQPPYGQPYYAPPPYGPPPYGPPGEVPLSQPLYGASLGQAVQRFWKKYATFTGRASRAELWWWFLVSYLVSFALGIVGQAVFGPPPQPSGAPTQQELERYFVAALLFSLEAASIAYAFQLLTLVGSLALSARRLHDTNRSGWWTLLFAVPVVGQIIVIVFWASAPVPAGQRYDRAGA